jgi:hypothetical protein
VKEMKILLVDRFSALLSGVNAILAVKSKQNYGIKSHITHKF